MKRATVYFRKKMYLVSPSSKTTDGVWLLVEPCIAVPEASSNEELERAIRVSLDRSRTDIPHPRIWERRREPLLELAGVKSWSTFSKGASCLDVEDEGYRIVLVPTKNLGSTKGFVDDLSRQIILDGYRSDVLGAAVRQLMMQDT